MRKLAGFAMLMLLGASVAHAQTPKSTVEELIKLENNWSRAAVARDGATLPRFYADDYTFTDADGIVSNKTKEIANITTGMFKLTAYKFDQLTVRVYGDIAVVTGQNTIKGVWEDVRRDVSGPYRFTDVFVKRNGQWRCVTRQASRVAGD